MLIGLKDALKYTLKGLTFKFEQWRLSTHNYEEISTPLGKVKGVQRYTVWGDTYYSFERIPFAKPPLGELRFKAPVPVEPWVGVLDCTRGNEKPLQANAFLKYSGTEDCLYLNVYTNNLKPAKPRPVMVWIYGGGFQMGEATRDSHGPDYFVTKDIVFVTLNYRVGALGFLTLKDPEADVPGNAGIKDQIQSIKWVHQNIASFGGDPNNVTLFGISAGGASTHLCLLSEEVKGLVHKSIIMAGSALCPWARPVPKSWAYRLAKKLDYKGPENDLEILQFLRSAKASDIIVAGDKIIEPEDRVEDRVHFAYCPVVEPYVSKNCALSKNPHDVMKNTWSNEIPVLMGSASFEGLLFYRESKYDKSFVERSKTLKNLLPIDADIDFNSPQADEFAAKLKKIHFNDEEVNSDSFMKLLDVQSYREFWHPIYRTIVSRLRNGSANTYVYRFDLDTQYANCVRSIFCDSGVRGTCHGDEIGFMFNAVIAYRAPKDSLEYKVIRLMIDVLTTFAATGDPNCQSISDVDFKPVTSETEIKCLNISNETKFVPLPEMEKIKVWNSLYPVEKL